MLDGFDLGLGALLGVLGRSEHDRRIIYNAIGPFWNGNEVWLITAGGVTFAAFPTTYAVMFSSLYSALMLILFALIIRAVSLEFRGKLRSRGWRRLWDGTLFVSSLLPALLFGVAFANIFRGIPIDHNGVYHGSLVTLLNPYGLCGGVLFLVMFALHGAIWLAIKSDGPIQQRAARAASMLWVILLVAAGVFLAATAVATSLYENYISYPVLFVIPVIAVASLLATRRFIARRTWFKAWFASCAFIAFVTFFGMAGLYPNLLPSSLDEAYSLTIYNSSSSPLTLKIMLGVVLVFVPIVILYQIWAYRVFIGKLTEKDLAAAEAY